MKLVTDYWTDMTWIMNGTLPKDAWTCIFMSLPKLLNMTDLQKVHPQIGNDVTKANGQDPQVEIETTKTDWDRWSQVLIDRDFYIKHSLALTKHQLLKTQLPSTGLWQTLEAVIAKENGDYQLWAHDKEGNIRMETPMNWINILTIRDFLGKYELPGNSLLEVKTQ
jgi:hypothetical protein